MRGSRKEWFSTLNIFPVKMLSIHALDFLSTKQMTSLYLDRLLIDHTMWHSSGIQANRKPSCRGVLRYSGPLLNAAHNGDVSTIYQSINLHDFLSITDGVISSEWQARLTEKRNPAQSLEQNLVHDIHTFATILENRWQMKEGQTGQLLEVSFLLMTDSLTHSLSDSLAHSLTDRLTHWLNLSLTD